ncbi:hypothetical protein ACTL6P_22595 [Endozoicomonas acroporae]|uniref:hypothetical protein n=1 Tax=Endozoicomonas acroporae TaxID=1701104 RepID=UPI0013D73F5C|nr:hypothetical protein [Endozoicomonas acroporae]
MKVGRLHFKNQQIDLTKTKGKRIRSIPLDEDLYEAAKQHLEQQGSVYAQGICQGSQTPRNKLARRTKQPCTQTHLCQSFYDEQGKYHRSLGQRISS